MARKRLLLWIAIVAILVLASSVAMLCLRAGSPSEAQVHHILLHYMLRGQNKWDEGINRLWALGPDVVPRLAVEATCRDTPFSKLYADLWQKSPASIKGFLPRPVNRADLREAAMHAIAEFGPLAVRRAAPQVIVGMGEKDFWHENYAIRGATWLLPESKAALNALKYGLAGTGTNWPRPDSFLNVYDDGVGTNSVWKRMPEVVPLLTNILDDSAHAYMAAIALGRIGSNAAPAIPGLIQTVEMGAAGVSNEAAAHTAIGVVFSNPLGFHLANVHRDDKALNHNRAMAVLALGRVGIATPEVRAALVRAWNAPDPWVRHNAALAVAMLGRPMTNELPGLLAGLEDPDNSALDSKLTAIGELGPDARGALADVNKLTQTNYLRSLITNSDTQVVGWGINDLATSAKVAIARINPDEGRPFLGDIASEIGRAWGPVLFLTEPSPLSNDIVRTVEPLLDKAKGTRQSLAAYVIISQDRQHAKALATLRRNRANGELNDRLIAARLLFESIGETNGLCAVISEAFQDPRSFPGQTAGQTAEKMGTNALPALPAFRAALWHKDQFVRQRAGALVLKLSPQDLPINEPK